MTKAELVEKRRGSYLKAFRSIILLLGIMFFGLYMPGEVSEYVRSGMDLAVRTVIPSSFTFMILSDLYVSFGDPEQIGFLRRAFTSLFGLSTKGLGAFISGNVGGFPIGAKLVSDRYSLGLIKKDEAERLIPLCSNPSCAFMVGGVGLGIYKDARLGIMLAISVYASTVICGILTKPKHSILILSDDISEQNYNFVDSVKAAGMSCISLISFITLFSVIGGIIKKRVNYAPLSIAFSLFLEVTNAVKDLSIYAKSAPLISLSLSAFALGFGGFSVAMQSAIFASGCGLGMKKYYLIKLLEGVVCASVFSLLYYINSKCGAA